ncbi:MAG: T9SS type A sorting domain-containing protein [Armatimonadetes bacterium]|nr:T9SS type A sorting domain-containing protein [Armatimonadota bacterium]
MRIAAPGRSLGGVFRSALLCTVLLPPSPATAADVFIATAGTASGSGALLADGTTTVRAGLLGLHTRVWLRYQDSRVYIMQGEGRDRLFVLIPSAWLAPVVEFSTGAGSAPRDVVVLPDDELYVSLHGRSYLVRVDAYSGEVLARIDLGALDADGIPDMTKMILQEGRLYVLCERLGGASTGTIAVIDVRTESPIDMDPSTAGLQGLDLAGTRPADLGGQVLGLALRSNRQGFANLRTDDVYRVLPVDLLRRSIGVPLRGMTGGPINDLVIDDTRLIVADDGAFEFDFAAGLYIYDVDTGDLLEGPIDTGQKPKRLVVVAQHTITAVDEQVAETVPARNRLLPPFPNPFNAGVTVALELHSEALVQLTIHDLLGRRVRTLLRSAAPTGTHNIRWNGRDDDGVRVASGIYIARLRTEDGVSTRRLVLAR